LLLQKLIELVLDAFANLPVIQGDLLTREGDLVGELKGTEIEPFAFTLDFRKYDQAILRLILTFEGLGRIRSRSGSPLDFE
jgi:hypothetical protein